MVTKVNVDTSTRKILKSQMESMIKRVKKYKDKTKQNPSKVFIVYGKPSYVTFKKYHDDILKRWNAIPDYEKPEFIYCTMPPVKRPTNTCPDNNLSKGCTGNNVTALEYWMRDHGFYKKAIDKTFGAYLRAAVMSFQNAANLTRDGVVGAKTRAAMADWGKAATGVYVESAWRDYNQTTHYSCGPSSSIMALSTLGVSASEGEMMRHEGTGYSGTDPYGIIAGCVRQGKEKGVRIQGWTQSIGSTGWAGLGRLIANKKIAVILHGNTRGWRKYYKGSYGHYVFPVKVDTKRKEIWIADPARQATLRYTFAQFINGLNYVSGPSLVVLKRLN